MLPILRDVTQGVRFLHAAKPQVIHGDLKAQNILVDSNFRAKVTDFGFSQKKRLGVMGTPFWMAPELLRGQVENNAASDVYAFGMILYEVYSREDPYAAEEMDDIEILKLIANPDINKRPDVPENMPAEVQGLMTACLRADPTTRPSFEALNGKFKSADPSLLDPSSLDPQHHAHSLSDENESTPVGSTTDERERYLFQSFPEHIAAALAADQKIDPETRDCVTVLFCQIADFAELSTSLAPVKVSDLLNRFSSRIDELSQVHNVFKMETVGDSYMAVTNLVEDQSDDHASRMANFALDAQQVSQDILIDTSDPSLGHVQLRIGFHSGPAVANVVGLRNPRYCLFGDTVNVARHVEMSCSPGHIQVSERTALLLQVQCPTLSIYSRGEIAIKGKGILRTYLVAKGAVSDEGSSSSGPTPPPPPLLQTVSSGGNSTKSRWDP